MNFGIAQVPVITIDLQKHVSEFTITDAAATNTIAKANKWISSKKLDKESMSKIGNAIKSIKAGNKTLAKRLDKLLNDMGNPDDQLIPVTPEEIVQMINNELGNIIADNTNKNGESYIFASFNY